MEINAVKRASLATFGKKSAHPNFMLRGLGPVLPDREQSSQICELFTLCMNFF